jgi:hypothetical protein
MSLLVSSCLSVWSGYVHLLFCTKSFDSKFQVPSTKQANLSLQYMYLTACERSESHHGGVRTTAEWRGIKSVTTIPDIRLP